MLVIKREYFQTRCIRMNNIKIDKEKKKESIGISNYILDYIPVKEKKIVFLYSHPEYFLHLMFGSFPCWPIL